MRAIVRAFRGVLIATACLAGAAALGAGATAQPLMPTTTREFLAATPDELSRFLESARPSPLSAEQRAQVLASLPQEGEVTVLDEPSRVKLEALSALLHAVGRHSLYVIKVIDVPQAAVGLHARTVVLVSQSALALLTAGELQAVVAHEIGHEYVWTEFEVASSAGDAARLQDLELVCDIVAVVMLRSLGLDAGRLVAGLEKMIRYSRERFGAAGNEDAYPPLARRRAITRAIDGKIESTSQGTGQPAVR